MEASSLAWKVSWNQIFKILQLMRACFRLGCDRACQKECINVHNKYRANHGAKPLVFDQKLADEAQALIDKGVFKHSDWVKLKNKGAAFAWGSLFPTFTAVIKNWHDEGFYYDYQKGAPKKPTQVSIVFSCCYIAQEYIRTGLNEWRILQQEAQFIEDSQIVVLFRTIC